MLIILENVTVETIETFDTAGHRKVSYPYYVYDTQEIMVVTHDLCSTILEINFNKVTVTSPG